MTSAANQLFTRVMLWQLAFTALPSIILGLWGQHLLLFSGPIGLEATFKAAAGIAVGGIVGMGYSAWLIGGRRYVLRYLALGSALPNPSELRLLDRDPSRITWGWFLPIACALLVATTVVRPIGMDLSTGLTLCLLGTVIVAATALPLMVFVRAAYLRAMELAPPEVMGEIVNVEAESGRLERRLRLPKRLVAAVTTPVLFVALGSALIANAHIRRNDEKNREESARALARAVLEPHAGAFAGSGLNAALRQAKALGFDARLHDGPVDYSEERLAGGVVVLTTPLDTRGAEVRFSGSTVGVVSAELMALAFLSVLLAGSLGMWVGRVLIHDLRVATRGVNALGTEAVLARSRSMRPARFFIVGQMVLAIDRLAARFRVFALAQERAIQARRAASRARGMFFASVSHDLKSPLNAILGFTELVRVREQITPGQAESLELIQRRGRELLALIETILDAARVEAGQLKLSPVPFALGDLVRQATAKAHDLAGEAEVRVDTELADTGAVLVDPDRMPGALGTFIAHGIRSAAGGSVLVKVRRGTGPVVLVEVEIPAAAASAAQLEAMLDPAKQPGAGQHRGLALGLRLARAIVELHGASVTIKAGDSGLVYQLRLEATDAEPRPPSSASHPIPE